MTLSERSSLGAVAAVGMVRGEDIDPSGVLEGRQHGAVAGVTLDADLTALAQLCRSAAKIRPVRKYETIKNKSRRDTCSSLIRDGMLPTEQSAGELCCLTQPNWRAIPGLDN